MTDTQDVPAEFVGYKAAAEYLGLARNTLSSYVSRGIGPAEKLDADGKLERRIDGQYLLPVFERAELDRWQKNRPGQGARTDLTSADALDQERQNREESREAAYRQAKAEGLAEKAEKLDSPKVPAFYGP